MQFSLLWWITGNPLAAAVLLLLGYAVADWYTFGFLRGVARTVRNLQRAPRLGRQIAVNPHDRRARIELGEILIEQGRFARAIEVLRPAAQQDPHDLSALYPLGIAVPARGARRGFRVPPGPRDARDRSGPSPAGRCEGRRRAALPVRGRPPAPGGRPLPALPRAAPFRGAGGSRARAAHRLGGVRDGASISAAPGEALGLAGATLPATLLRSRRLRRGAALRSRDQTRPAFGRLANALHHQGHHRQRARVSHGSGRAAARVTVLNGFLARLSRASRSARSASRSDPCRSAGAARSWCSGPRSSPSSARSSREGGRGRTTP